MRDEKTFYRMVRESLFGGILLDKQFAGIQDLLAKSPGGAACDPRWQANVLAQVFRETDKTMQPIKEYGGASYFKRMYDIEGDYPDRARQMGNVNPGDGALFCGRGHIMITFRSNYAKMGKILGIPLEEQPDLALVPANSVAIVWEGMTRGASNFGDFTGKSLEDYFNASTDDPFNARRIVNGLDHAQEIADNHALFLAALKAAA